MADDKPKVKDGPPATTGGKASGGIGVLAKPAGPLPVYGWLAVGVAAIFLYRKLYGSSAGAASATPSDATSTGAGAVYIVPGSGPGGGTSNPVSQVPTKAGATIPVATAIDLVANYNKKVGSQPLNAAGKQFLNQLSKLPTAQEKAAEDFFQHNNAARELNQPYFKGTNSKGIPVLYNPVTGYQHLVTTNGTATKG
jgi:hypothetical protein